MGPVTPLRRATGRDSIKMAHDSIIAALEAALDVDPTDRAVREHLASLLLKDGRPSEALDHFAHILSADPANLAAVRGAADAARAAGDTARAEGYGRLLSALETDPAPMTSTPVSATDVTPSNVVDARARLRVVSADESGPWEVERPDVVLADVGGMEDVQGRLNTAFLAPLRNPEMMKAYGKSLRGGLLLFGPPGCGKTFVARATAGELGARFLTVGLSDVLDMWLGESERKLHEIFETARRSRPCVLFFDEIDALGQKRSHLRHHAGRNVVNQLLAELDSVGADNSGVFVLAATNHPWDVDTALRRPGRFDRMLLVLPPDKAAREAILRYHMRDRPAAGVDYALLATKTNLFSGADLAHLCESATDLALEDSISAGSIRPVGMSDFTRALKEVRPSTRPWFDTARNYAMFANEGGLYDDLLTFMRENKF